MARALALLAALLAVACGGEPTTDEPATASQVEESDVAQAGQPLGTPPELGCIGVTYGGHDYWFCPQLRSWSSARTRCENRGYNLVRLEGAAENEFVRARIGISSWIGGTDAVEGAWKWTFGGSTFWTGNGFGAPFGGLYTNWAFLQPDNFLNQDCTRMFLDGKWTDEACGLPAGYVCESGTDECPTDPQKVVAGVCGCGVPDVDSDADGLMDCHDQCPLDPTKKEPGDCGCSNTPAPVGTPCNDGLCAANTACGSAGVCGNPAVCAAPDSDCEYGIFRNTYYWFCDNDRSYTNVQQRCQGAGMQLTVVDSAPEDAFLSTKIREHSFIGGTDLGSEGNWFWSATGTQFWSGGLLGGPTSGSYTNWDPFEPNNLLNQDCLTKEIALFGGQWDAHPCSFADAFVCEQVDLCPTNPDKATPGVCGCESSDPDKDGDGTPDCVDDCVDDPLKIEPGVCDCGIPDVDSDGDGLADCVDTFPGDPNNGTFDTCSSGSGTAPAGTVCCDGVCPGTHTCNGSGGCGDPGACAPAAGCVARAYGDSWYWFCPQTVDWSTANTSCRATPGRSLVRVQSAKENAFLTFNLSATAWTGASDAGGDGDWRWSTATGVEGAQFWAGGASGAPVEFRYARWDEGQPSAGPEEACGAIDGTTGQWSDLACSNVLGYVCEQPRHSLATCPQGATFGDGIIPELEVDRTPPATPNCVPLELSTLGTPTAFDELEACNLACPTPGPGEADPPANCVDQCSGAAEPPPPGSCPDATSNELRYCEAGERQASPDVPCTSDQDCDVANGFLCLHVREGATCFVCPETSTSCDQDCHAIERNVCAKPHENCGDFTTGDCVEEEICALPGPEHEQTTAELDVEIAVGPTDPAVLFAPPMPDRVPTDPWADENEVILCSEGIPCSGSSDISHAWCHYALEGTETLNTRELADGSRHGSAGNGKLIEFNFDPRLYVKADASPGPLGAATLDLRAEASLSAGARFSLLGINSSLEIIDIGAAVQADRCEVTSPEVDARFEVLGVDFLPTLIGSADGEAIPGTEGIPYESTGATTCASAWSTFTHEVNRTKKAMKDARDLIEQYQAAKAAGQRLSQSLYGEIAGGGADVPADFVTPSGEEPPEATINRFVDLYELQATQKIQQALANVVLSAPSIPSSVPLIDVPSHDETQLLARVQFAIGPIPCVMELEGVVRYGANISAEVDLRPHLPVVQLLFNPEAGDEEDLMAFVKLNGTPFAGAAVRLFVGAGFGANGFEAKAGVEGEVSIGTVQAPSYAGVGVSVAATDDPRPIPAALQALQNDPGNPSDSFIQPREYHYRLRYMARSSVGVMDMLSGWLGGKVKISFFFFSKTWRQRIATFNGFCAGSGNPRTAPPSCTHPIFDAEDSAKWGTIRMPMPFTKVKRLEVEPLDLSKPIRAGSKDRAGLFFYDDKCIDDTPR